MKSYEFSLPMVDGPTCIASAWAKTPVALSTSKKEATKAKIRALLKARNALIVAHYYVDGDIQDLAMETGGFVADSLEMARFAKSTPPRI